MKQYLVICYQHEACDSFIVDDLREFILEYNYFEDPTDEKEIKKQLKWLLNRDQSEHEVYEVQNGKLVLISQN